MDRGYSPPGCRNRRFKDSGRETTLIVRILGVPRMMVGSKPNSLDPSLLRLARLAPALRSRSFSVDHCSRGEGGIPGVLDQVLVDVFQFETMRKVTTKGLHKV